MKASSELKFRDNIIASEDNNHQMSSNQDIK